MMNDARLKSVVTMALNSSRDVQKAIADIDAARAQYGETRSSLFPTVDAELKPHPQPHAGERRRDK